MTPEAASLVHHGILAFGIVIWFAALIVHRRAFRAPDEIQPTPLREGEEKVPAPLEDVRTRLIEALRGGGLGQPGTIRIEEAGDLRIRGTATPLLGGSRRGTPLTFQVDFGTTHGGTKARWTLQGCPSRGLKFASGLFLYILTPLAMAAAVVVMRTLVLGSDSPAVRTQAIQTIHILHFVWPPFLFAWVARRLLDAVAGALRNVIANCGF